MAYSRFERVSVEKLKTLRLGGPRGRKIIRIYFAEAMPTVGSTPVGKSGSEPGQVDVSATLLAENTSCT